MRRGVERLGEKVKGLSKKEKEKKKETPPTATKTLRHRQQYGDYQGQKAGRRWR